MSDVLPEGRKRLEVDGLQHVLGSVELQQQHDEDSVVRQLLELCLTDVVVLNQHADDNAQHLQKQSTFSKAAAAGVKGIAPWKKNIPWIVLIVQCRSALQDLFSQSGSSYYKMCPVVSFSPMAAIVSCTEAW